MPVDEIDRRARALADRLGTARRASAPASSTASPRPAAAARPGARCRLGCVTLAVSGETPSGLLERLRTLDPPVIARIVNDEVVLDLRTVLPEDEEPLAQALLSL